MVRVAINIVTYNSADDIVACIESVQAQTFRDFRIHVLDNDSRDQTIERIAAYELDLVRSNANSGFAKAHNDLIRSFPAEFALILNPDAILRPDFLAIGVRALEARPDAASLSGKLLRLDGKTIDSAGIVWTRNQRHLDRGADEPDLGQFDKPEEVFGPSGAAALYRVQALKDTSFDGQYFDEDFFAYREDADLAWRCRLMGWTSIYEPDAVALHRRRVTPERRSQLSALINYHGVKNRFLLRLNNITGSLYRRDFWQITSRDAAVIGWVLIREWSSIGALLFIFREWPRLWEKRRLIQSRRRVGDEELNRWFGDRK